MRDEAKIGGRAFNQLTKDIAKLDGQLGKTAKTTQSRGGARQATQIAGAVISGGIFGGPEGALGAAGGAALGGVEGAFAGAAIGAQVGAFREALAASAEYAAEIGKLQIALRGVTDVQGNAAASQANYSEALEAAAQSTRITTFHKVQRFVASLALQRLLLVLVALSLTQRLRSKTLLLRSRLLVAQQKMYEAPSLRWCRSSVRER